MIKTAENQMNSISTFDITKYPLLDILKDIKIGRIQLPDFQRDWVWDDAHVRRLLASISLAYPIGAVMMLQQGNQRVQFKPRPIDGVNTPEYKAPNLLILDGQQRLTTLFMVLLSQQPVSSKTKKANTSSKNGTTWTSKNASTQISIDAVQLLPYLNRKECEPTRVT